MMLRFDVRLTDSAVLEIIQHHIQTPLTQRQIATIIGCSERTVNRSIKRLVSAGLLEIVDGGSYYPYEYAVTESA